MRPKHHPTPTVRISQSKEPLPSNHSLAWDSKISPGKQHPQLLLGNQKNKIDGLTLSGVAICPLIRILDTNFIF